MSRDGALRVRALHPSVGAEVRGVELAEPTEPETLRALRDLWHRHLVLVFPEQAITDAQQIAFSGQFGTLEEFPLKSVQSSREKQIFRVTNVDESGNLAPDDSELALYATLTQNWHIDSSYRPIPSKGALLHGIEVTHEGGDTWFVNLIDVLEALPPHLLRVVAEGKAVHDFRHPRRLQPDARPLSPAEEAAVPPVTHPLVRVHPETGRRSLFLSPVYMTTIVGWGLSESRAFIEELTTFALAERFVYRHRWSSHDVLMWDNRSVMHAGRSYDAARVRRVMHRTCLAGQGA